MSRSGFTLIELLIVISIIAVLAAIGLASYGSFMKRARDSRRQADLKLIQSALERYHADQFYYPVAVIPGGSIAEGTKIYLSSIPNDPMGADPTRANYEYQPLGANCAEDSPKNCTDYCLYATLERLKDTNSNEGDPECLGGRDATDGVYAVTRP